MVVDDVAGNPCVTLSEIAFARIVDYRNCVQVYSHCYEAILDPTKTPTYQPDSQSYRCLEFHRQGFVIDSWWML